jgi:hypothetical protein
MARLVPARFLGLGLTALAIALAGCGRTGVTSAPVSRAVPAARAVTVVHDAMDMTTPGGRFDVVFQGLKASAGYSVQAVRADIARVRITLTSPKLVEPLVKELDRAALDQLVVTVPFTNVPAGDVAVQVQAIDANGRVIGVKASSAAITANQTTVLQLAVRLDADTGSGNLGAAITFEDATPAPSSSPVPTASPTATPTPSPVPTATPVVVLESYKLVRHLFANPEVEVTLHNPTAEDAKARVYMYFYSDNTLKDSQAREIPLTADQRMTFRCKANAYAINRVTVSVK